MPENESFLDPKHSDSSDGLSSIETVIRVSELNRRTRQLLESEIGRCWIEGEISSLSQPQSGHKYFTLKDDQAQVRCALFRPRSNQMNQDLREGMQVQVYAQVSLFEARGDYQLIVEAVRPTGTGALLAALEVLKQKLQAEGLFNHTRSLPYPPKHLVIITSPTGAAIRDVLSVLSTRWPWIQVTLIATAVQGAQAAAQIIQAFQRAQTIADADAILLTRGGGSLEDLWCFNDEALSRAIYMSSIPVITGIGHEIDFTLADFVADQRAPTPSAAAERLTPDQRDVRRAFAQLAQRLLRLMDQRLQNWQQRLDYLNLRLRDPQERLQAQLNQNKELTQRLHQAMRWQLRQQDHHLVLLNLRLQRQWPQAQLEQLKQQLSHLQFRWQQQSRTLLSTFEQALAQLSQRLQIASPHATLARGYAVVHNQEGTLIQRADQTHFGEVLRVQLSEGSLEVTVQKHLS